MSDASQDQHRRRLRRVDPIVWVATAERTRRLAEQTAEALYTRELAEKLAQTYRNLDLPQRAGHMFELMHAANFNHDAAAKGARIRAHVTGLEGEPGAAADIRLVDGSHILAEAQAKFHNNAMRAAVEHAREKYRGMQRLVPSEQADPVSRVLDEGARRHPEGLRHDGYVDAGANLTDHLHADDVRSTPLESDQVRRAAKDPKQWAARRAARTAARQVGGAALTGAVSGAVLSGVIEAGAQAARVRAGETSVGAAASSAAGAAARGAVRSGALAGLGETVRIAAAAHELPSNLSAGAVPAAVASAIAAVSSAGFAFARDEIGRGELAAQCCEATLQPGLVWACGAVAQTVIPVPVVGALAGGMVGQWSATVIAQGLREAATAAREDGLDERVVAQLEAEACEAAAAAAHLAEAERALGQQRNAYLTATVAPLLDDALDAVAAGSPDAIKLLTELTTSFAGEPLFCTVDEFDCWMRDPDSLLVLDPNVKSRARADRRSAVSMVESTATTA